MSLKHKISLLVTIIVLAWVAVFLWGKRAELAPYLQIDRWHLAGLVAAAFLYTFFQGVLLKTVLVLQGIRLRTAEWFGCIVVTLMWNYLVPFAGIGYRALYLKRVHGLEYQNFLASTSAIYVLEILVFGLGGLAGLIVVYGSRGTLATELLVLFGSIAAFALVLLLCSPKPPAFPGRFYGKLVMMLEAWYRAKRSPWHIAQCTLWTVLIFLSYSAMYYLAFSALQASVSFGETFVVSALSDFSLFVRLTPAAIGPFEASVAYSARLYEVDLAHGLLAAGLIRMAIIVVFLALGPWFQHRLTVRMASAPATNIDA